MLVFSLILRHSKQVFGMVSSDVKLRGDKLVKQSSSRKMQKRLDWAKNIVYIAEENICVYTTKLTNMQSDWMCFSLQSLHSQIVYKVEVARQELSKGWRKHKPGL